MGVLIPKPSFVYVTRLVLWADCQQCGNIPKSKLSLATKLKV